MERGTLREGANFSKNAFHGGNGAVSPWHRKQPPGWLGKKCQMAVGGYQGYSPLMRNIGTLPNQTDASRLSDALCVRGIENETEKEDDGSYSIWVHDDAQLGSAREMLAKYRNDPQVIDFATAAAEAARLRKQEEKAERQRGSTVVTPERLGYERNFQGFAWLPIVLIIACIAVAVQSDTVLDPRPKSAEWLRWLFISWEARPILDPSFADLTEIREGQLWRLFTPMLIHFGLLHLLFNMMWLRELGTFVQNRFGVLYLAVLILAVAATSNLAQFWEGGANFGGMSGVNYGLFGFLWMRGKFDRFAGWKLNPGIVQTMMLWFFLCFTPLLPNIANTAHTVGLLVGGAWGYLSARMASRR